MLQQTYSDGCNVGVRLGKWSKVGGGYLHAIDLDIRDPEASEEAREALHNLLPDLSARIVASVVSGSGGESRHYYILTDYPFPSKKLARSSEKMPDSGSWTWEIELFGTGKQVALPPSIHPDTGLPYRWERRFDLDEIELGVAPFLAAGLLGELVSGDRTNKSGGEPLGRSIAEIRATLDALQLADWCDDRDGWLTVGMALHHETGGSDAGFDAWCRFAAQSPDKFDKKDQRRVWKSFGKQAASQPVTMRTLEAEARAHRAAEIAFEDLDDLEAREDDGQWRRTLELDARGGIKPTLTNVATILQNDHRLSASMQLNQFTGEVVSRQPLRCNLAVVPRFKIRDEINGDLWQDHHDEAIRALLEAPFGKGKPGYGLKVSDRDLRGGVNLAARQNAFHPVRDYLQATTWDGTPRAERLFIDYLGAADSPYSRHVARNTLLGAVVRIFEPGHKFDFVPILEGLQGKRKSTFIEILARHWFAELQGDFSDRKRMIEKMQGAWILEIPELQGFSRAEVQEIKGFVSGKTDKDRLAYDRRAKAFPRQCIFMGSTNESEYLRDATGGRRFWPVMCNVDEINTDRLRSQVDQIWAEAVYLYHEMRKAQPRGQLPLFITDPDARKEAERLQESRRIETAEDALTGQIAAWLDRPHGSFEDEDPKPLDRTCCVQIWTECLRHDKGSYGPHHAQIIGRAMRRVPGWKPLTVAESIPPYGRQRVYLRVEPKLFAD